MAPNHCVLYTFLQPLRLADLFMATVLQPSIWSTKTHGFAINFCYTYLKDLESADLLDTM